MTETRGTGPDPFGFCTVLREGAARSEISVPDNETTFLAPISDPPAIYCAGANYHDHVLEMSGGDLPENSELETFHFLASPAALTGHRQPVRRPPRCLRLDWEVELAVVVGRGASHLSTDEAPAYVAGYSIANDISVRDHVYRPNPVLGIDWLRHKSFSTLLPLGPAIIPSRHVPEPLDLGLRLSVNGELRQDSNTSQMIFSVWEQLAELSSIVRLQPGDLVLTGTPAGTAAAHGRHLEPGDAMVAEIDVLGHLKNHVTGPAEGALRSEDAPSYRSRRQ